LRFHKRHDFVARRFDGVLRQLSAPAAWVHFVISSSA
jgi:hypothetical protein